MSSEVDLDNAIEQLRVKYNIPRPLLDRMLHQESGGDDRAVSPLGAKSRFQVMPATFDLYNKEVGGVLNADSPLDNAYVGLRILSDNYKRFRPKAKSEQHAWGMAIAGYHGSPDSVDRDLAAGGTGIPDQGDGLINTRDHVYAIMSGLNPEDFSVSTVPLREQVTSEAKPYEAPERQVLTFEPETDDSPGLSRLARASRGLAESVSMQGLKLPETHPDRVGKSVELRFKVTPEVGAPTPAMISDAFLQKYGYGDLGEQFKQESGGYLLAALSAPANPKIENGEYVISVRPTRGLIEGINAYATNGMDGLRSALQSQQIGRVNIARDVEAALKERRGVRSDLQKAGTDVMLASAQYAENLKNLALAGGPNYDHEFRNAGAIAEARAGLPKTGTWTGAVAEVPIGAAGTIARAGTAGPLGVAGFPVQATIENAQAGPEQAVKAGLLTVPLVAAGPIARSVGADALSPVARQATNRALAATAGAETALASGGELKDVARELVTGALFPVGGRRPVEEFIHLDFGRVRVAENQASVPRNKVRVVDDQDQEHVIIKPSSARNQRAIPVRDRLGETIEQSGSLRDRATQLEGELAQWQRAGGKGKKGKTRIAQIRRELEITQAAIEHENQTAAQRVSDEQSAAVEATRYSETPRFDEWAEDVSGQRLGQIDQAEVSRLRDEYRQLYRDAPSPPLLRELPPLDSTVPRRPQREVRSLSQEGPPKREASPIVSPDTVPPDHIRYYRADRAEATGPEGKGWATDPEYVSRKYGAAEQGSESVWYVDVPIQALDAEYGDARTASIIDNPERFGATRPQLLRRSESPARDTGRQFPKSQLVDDQNQLVTVYHQTPKAAERPIREQGFDIDNKRALARRTDEGVPDGIFFKPTDENIFAGSKDEDFAQIGANLNMESPLRVGTREDLVEWGRRDPEYSRLQSEVARYTTEKRLKLYKEMASDDRQVKAKAEQEYQALIDKATAARARLTAVLKESGHDSVIMERDVGGPKETKTYIVLGPTQVSILDSPSKPAVIRQEGPRQFSVEQETASGRQSVTVKTREDAEAVAQRWNEQGGTSEINTEAGAQALQSLIQQEGVTGAAHLLAMTEDQVREIASLSPSALARRMQSRWEGFTPTERADFLDLIGPPSRKTASLAGQIKSATDANDISMLNTLLEQAGITDADLAIEAAKGVRSGETTVPARTPAGPSQDEAVQVREGETTQTVGSVPARDSAATRSGEQVAGFKTSQGSTYTVNGESTQRTKSLHKQHDPKDTGLKEASERTVYISPTDATRIGQHGGLSGRKAVIVRGDQVLLVSWNEQQGKWGMAPLDRENPIRFTTRPTIGQSPLELWRGNDGTVGREYGKWHPGNEITELVPVKQESSVPTRERAFPITLDEAGLPKGSNLTYERKTHADTLANAERIITEKGEQGALAWAMSGVGAEQTAVGSVLIKRLQDAGNIEAANDLASSMAERLTSIGQAADAARLVSTMSPEGILRYANKRIQKRNPEAKLDPNDAQTLIRLAEEGKTQETAYNELIDLVQGLQERVASLEARPSSGGNLRSTAAKWQEKLDAEAEAARQRIKDRQAQIDAGELDYRSAGPTPTPHLNDYITIGAAKLARKGIDLAVWTSEMVAEFGEAIRPHLQKIFQESYRIYSTEKKRAADETKIRSVTKGKQLPQEQVDELIRQATAARQRATQARQEMAHVFERLETTPTERAIGRLTDVLGAPRSIMSSGDISAMLRQGSVFTLTEFQEAGAATSKMLRAFSHDQYQQMMTEMQADPMLLKSKQDMGVEYSSPELRGNALPDEFFPSSLAEKVPLVKRSGQAYTIYLDHARLFWADKFSKEIESYAAESGWSKEQTQRALQQAGKFINVATGRGSLEFAGKVINVLGGGRQIVRPGQLDALTPLLNTVFFSPRYLASRLQFVNMALNPVSFLRLERPVQKIVMKKAWRWFATQGALLTASNLAGATQVSDPDDPSWLKIKVGDTSYDTLAGLQQNARFMYRMGQQFANIAASKTPEETKREWWKALRIAGRFGWSKSAPLPSLAIDKAMNESYMGEPFEWKREIVDRSLPLFVSDMYEAWQAEGLTGLAKGIPAATGIGVSQKPKEKPSTVPPRPPEAATPPPPPR